MIAAGVDLRIVSAALGLSSFVITSQRDAAAVRPTRRDAAHRLGELILKAR